MKVQKCQCGEPLITLDEQKRSSCWECLGMEWRLKVMDKELENLEAASRLGWEFRPAFRMQSARV